MRARKWRVALFVSSALIMDKYYVTGNNVDDGTAGLTEAERAILTDIDPAA